MGEEPLVAALDADYRPGATVAAGVWFAGWGAAFSTFEATATLPSADGYAPGEFYRRELPGLLAVLARGPRPAVVVVDGYVTLGEGRPGLGLRLREALGGDITVVGVAKTRYRSATEAVPVLRGGSVSPLWVTCAGADAAEAAAWVAAMAGAYRLPALLKRADRLAREG